MVDLVYNTIEQNKSMKVLERWDGGMPSGRVASRRKGTVRGKSASPSILKGMYEKRGSSISLSLFLSPISADALGEYLTNYYCSKYV